MGNAQARASWFFGTLLLLFILGVFIWAPPTLPVFKQQLLAYICATLAAFFAAFFTGGLLVDVNLAPSGQWAIKGGAGFAMFLVVLYYWSLPAARVRIESPAFAREAVGAQGDVTSPASKPSGPELPKTVTQTAKDPGPGTIASTQSPPPVRFPARVVTFSTPTLTMAGNEAAVLEQGDWEVDTDDFTRVDVSYDLMTDSTQRAVDVRVSMVVREMHDDHQHHNDDTRIRMTKVFRSVYQVPNSSPQKIEAIVSARNGSSQKEYAGKSLFGVYAFPDVSNLKHIQVRFDSDKDNDKPVQLFQGVFEGLQIRLGEVR